jgi:hypothetical protein
VRSKRETYGNQIVAPFTVLAVFGTMFSESLWAPGDEAMLHITQCVHYTFGIWLIAMGTEHREANSGINAGIIDAYVHSTQ